MCDILRHQLWVCCAGVSCILSPIKGQPGVNARTIERYLCISRDVSDRVSFFVGGEAGEWDLQSSWIKLGATLDFS